MFDFSDIIAGVQEGRIVPYLGPGALAGSCDVQTGAPLPADSDSLILAMNGGRPMAPRLMYEFPRAAMNLELKRGRQFVTRFLTGLYGERQWTRSPLHDWIAALKPRYVIDVNRDTQIQDSYQDTPHTLIVGIARIGGTEYRFRIFHYNGEKYGEIDPSETEPSLPILFKPMGTPLPEPSYIASDADYVDYITELMGGFGVPAFLKEYRKGKQYLLLGLPLRRDTERMVFSDISYGAAESRGWALLPDPTPKERRFCGRMGIEIIEADIGDLLAATGTAAIAEAQAEARQVGC